MANMLPAVRLFHTSDNVYRSLDADQQREKIDELKALIEVAERRNQEELVRTVGNGEDVTSYWMEGFVDNLNWKMTTWLRYSTPTRIYEATPYVQAVVTKGRRDFPDLKDPTPLVYLGVSQSHTPEAYERALENLTAGIELGNLYEHSRTLLWGLAARSKLLRRMGRVTEAKADERTVRTHILTHPYAMSVADFRRLVTEDGQEEDHIFDHPDLARFGANRVDVPGNGFLQNVVVRF